MNKLIARSVIVAAALLLPLAAAGAQVIPGPPDDGIAYTRVDEARKDLHADGKVLGQFRKARHSGWMIAKEPGNGVTWAFSRESHYAHPSVVRKKWFEQDGRTGWQNDLVCEAEPAACERLRAALPSLDTQMNPRATVAFLDRAADLGLRGDFEGAYAEYSKAIAIDPGHEQTYLRRGYAAFMKGDIDGAIEDFWKVIELSPQNADAYNDRCWVRAAADRDLPFALADCENAVRLAPGNAEVRDTRGFLHLRLALWDDAIADYDAALKIDPTLVAALYGRGLARHGKGDADAADADMAAARALDAGIAGEFVRYGLTR
jgi:tetratricopeptide (TPR) repeat protein